MKLGVKSRNAKISYKVNPLTGEEQEYDSVTEFSSETEMNKVIEAIETEKSKRKEFFDNVLEIKNNSNTSEWQPNISYQVNDYVLYNENLYRIIQAHNSQVDWLPSEVSALYVLLARKEEIENIETTIPLFKQPSGAHNAYNIGDKVLFNDKVYISLINANVWSPQDYPTGWKLV